MKAKNYFLLLCLAVFSFTVNAQDSFGPTSTGMIQGPIYVPSIAEQMRNGTLIPADDQGTLGHPKRRRGNNVVPGKGFPKGGDPLVDNQKSATQQRMQPPLTTFLTTTSTGTPGDPSGAANSGDHYVAAWNTSFRIFDKAGNPLTPAASLATLFPGNAIGDPIVFYDAKADRIVITEFDSSPNGFNVAVCQGNDPVNDGWYVYTVGFGTGAFPDYTKFAAFGDVYMVTANIGSSNKIFAVERNEMLNGNPAQFVALPLPGIATFGFHSPHAFHTTDDVFAPAGTPVPIVYMQDDAWGGVSDDHLKIWSASIDWANTSASSISTAQQIITADFTGVFDGGSFSNLPQPGGGPNQDVLQATMMNQVQYRRFAGYNSAVMNFVVDTEAGAGELAGIRWYELRQTSDGQPWTIYQEGTYVSPNNGKHAFSGSMAMNGNGDIAMGYTTISNTERIAIYYTGRLAGDPLGQMTLSEELIAQSTQNNPSLRLADYVQLSIDPADDTSFWHLAEYFEPGRRHVVAHFQLIPQQPNDIGITTVTNPSSGPLTATEDITVEVKNFGSDDITNPELQYIIDGGAPIIESFSGTISGGSTSLFTFTTQANLSALGDHIIVARTNLPADSNSNNDDAFIKITTTEILDLEDPTIAQAEFTVLTLPNKQFNISLTTEFEGTASIAVYNVLGQIVAFNNLNKEGDRFNYHLDMSYADTGVYFIKMGSQKSNTFKTAKIIVK